jgi:ankyrin repeat protein
MHIAHAATTAEEAHHYDIVSYLQGMSLDATFVLEKGLFFYNMFKVNFIRAKFFLDTGYIDINEKHGDGGTYALFFMRHIGFDSLGEIIEFFINHGASVNVYTNDNGTSALMYAVESDKIGLETIKLIVNTLKKEGGNVNYQNNKKRTALMEAAVLGKTDIVHYLVDSCGAKIALSDDQGLNACELARDNGHAELAHYLMRSLIAEKVLAA